jgi:hypothetical protein
MAWLAIHSYGAIIGARKMNHAVVEVGPGHILACSEAIAPGLIDERL